MKNRSWKTTSAGILLIASSIVGIYFAWKSNNLNEATVMGAITGIIGGVGLILAKDGNKTGLPVKKDEA